jgi:ankyrin repeat protein
LHWAAESGHPEAAAALLIAGADIHAIDSKVLDIQDSVFTSVCAIYGKYLCFPLYFVFRCSMCCIPDFTWIQN